MVHAKPALPAGHGEVLTRPAFEEWAALARSRTTLRRQSWGFSVAGVPAAELRAQPAERRFRRPRSSRRARRCASRSRARPESLVVATGHQPELYHPGVWIKDFLLQRLVRRAAGDGDRLRGRLRWLRGARSQLAVHDARACKRCQQYLAVGSPNGWYAGAPVPERARPERLLRGRGLHARIASGAGGAAALRDVLRRAAGRPAARGQPGRAHHHRAPPLRGARRKRLPRAAGDPARGDAAFRTFVADLALNADRFARAYNTELAEYRMVNKTRSAAQPFPDLAVSDGSVELPLWLLGASGPDVGPVRAHAERRDAVVGRRRDAHRRPAGGPRRGRGRARGVRRAHRAQGARAHHSSCACSRATCSSTAWAAAATTA